MAGFEVTPYGRFCLTPEAAGSGLPQGNPALAQYRNDASSLDAGSTARKGVVASTLNQHSR